MEIHDVILSKHDELSIEELIRWTEGMLLSIHMKAEERGLIDGKVAASSMIHQAAFLRECVGMPSLEAEAEADLIAQRTRA